MLTQCLPGILIPFAGTTLGSACVFFMKKTLHEGVQRALTGFAAGVMVAASIWSLLIPAMEQSEGLGRLAFIPAAVGFWLGIGFLLLLDMAVPHLHQGADTPEGPHSGFSRTTMLVLAVTLHNIPEGMAVGLAFALAADGEGLAGAAALALGIGVQNFPEGAAVALPLYVRAVEAARLCDRRALRRGGAAVRRAGRAGGGACACADAVAFELCGGGDALRCGRRAAAARGEQPGDVRLFRGLSFYDGAGCCAGIKIFLPPVAPERLTNGFTAIKL